MRIGSFAEFEAAVEAARAARAARTRDVWVCCGTGCLANGARKVADAFASRIQSDGLTASLGLYCKTTGCHGFCERGPLVVIQPEGILYAKVKAADVPEILDKTVGRGEVIPRLLYKDPVTKQAVAKYEDIPFYRHQTRVSMRNIGRIDWLPETCAYKLVHRGADLPWWHPLISGDPRTVHQAGISVRKKAISETKAGEPEDHIVDWIS